MYKKGREYSLRDIIQRFLEFAQLQDQNTQAWELLDTRLDTFYGATLRVPLKKYKKEISNYKYLVVGDSYLHIDKFNDYVSTDFNNPIFYEDYTHSDLTNMASDIFNYIQSYVPDCIIFNCCEDTINRGESARYVYDRIFEVEKLCRENDIEFRLYITPIPQMFVTQQKMKKYNILLRSSFISKHPVVVCFGDGLVSSWTNKVQSRFINTTIINRGIDWNTTADMLERFNTEVVQELPDICFIQVGIDDFFGGVPNSAGSLQNVEQNMHDIIGYCEKYGITPILGFYEYTIDQLTAIKSSYPSEFTNQVTNVYNTMETYFEHCKDFAKDKNIRCIDFSGVVKQQNGSIDPECFDSDSRLFSSLGNDRVGNCIADNIGEPISFKESMSLRYKVINLYDVFCSYLSVQSLDVVGVTSLLEGDIYKEDVQDAIVAYLKGNRYLDPVRYPYFYVSFQHTNIDKNSYRKWRDTGLSIPEYAVKNIKEQYSKKIIKHFYMSEGFNHYNDPPRTGKGAGNLFRNEGEFVAVGLHTVFDENLWMCEQGGITCCEEATNRGQPIGFIPPVELMGGINNKWDQHPLFPGTGCPWFTVSKENKENYDIENNGIDYWFTKNDCDATITIRYRRWLSKDIYQSISLGKMVTTDDESYMFPLFVAGGNQALSGDYDVYYPPRPGAEPIPIYGVMYDLDIRNNALTNSNLLFPTFFNGHETTNFRIMSPDGDWVNIVSLSQELNKSLGDICPRFSPRFTNGVFGIMARDPDFVGGNGYNTNLPYSSDARNLVDSYQIRDEEFDARKQSAMRNNIVIYLNRGTNHGEVGVMGTLPNSFFYGSRSCKSGEVVLNNKRYLSIPNCWEDRLMHYPLGICEKLTTADFSNPAKVSDFYDNMFDVMANAKFIHKLLIYLEDA